MNQYSEILNYIIALAQKDSFINTTTQGEASDALLDKNSIYPAFSIDISSGSFTGSTIIFNVMLTCVQQRDINSEIVNDKIYNNDNEVDNLNETLASLNRIWSIMHSDIYHKNITSNEATFDRILDENKDGLDGWSLSFDIEIGNTDLSICEGEV